MVCLLQLDTEIDDDLFHMLTFIVNLMFNIFSLLCLIIAIGVLFFVNFHNFKVFRNFKNKHITNLIVLIFSVLFVFILARIYSYGFVKLYIPNESDPEGWRAFALIALTGMIIQYSLVLSVAIFILKELHLVLKKTKK